MKINIDRLFDYMMEADSWKSDYCKSSKDFYKNHGYGASLDRAKTDEEKHIAYAYRNDDKSSEVVWSVIEVLGFDQEQRARLFSAHKAVKRWYEKETHWERCLPDDLIGRLTTFILGTSA